MYRGLVETGHHCEVVAPSLVPRRSGERVKTDRRDALMLARLHRSGEWRAVWVADAEQEAMRDLTRAREDLKGLELKARQRLGAFFCCVPVGCTGKARAGGRRSTFGGWRSSGSPIRWRKAQAAAATVQAIAWAAQKRLCARYWPLYHAGKAKCQVTTAVARERVGFIWAVACEVMGRPHTTRAVG